MAEGLLQIAGSAAREGCQCNQACHGQLPLTVPVPRRHKQRNIPTAALRQKRKVWSEKRGKKPLTPNSTILPDLSPLVVSSHTFYLGVSREQRAKQPPFCFFFLFFLVMRRMMKRNEGHFWNELTDNTGSAPATCSPPFSPKQIRTREEKKLDKNRLAGIIIQSFPPFFSFCVSLFLTLALSLSLSLSSPLSHAPGTITKPWLERSHDFLPESHSIPSKYSADIVKTSFVQIKTLAQPASSQNLAPSGGEGGGGPGGGVGSVKGGVRSHGNLHLAGCPAPRGGEK